MVVASCCIFLDNVYISKQLEFRQKYMLSPTVMFKSIGILCPSQKHHNVTNMSTIHLANDQSFILISQYH